MLARTADQTKAPGIAALFAIFFADLGGLNALLAADTGTCTGGIADNRFGLSSPCPSPPSP